MSTGIPGQFMQRRVGEPRGRGRDREKQTERQRKRDQHY